LGPRESNRRLELQNTYSSSDFIKVFPSRTARWARQEARMGAMISAEVSKKPKGRDHFGELYVHGLILLKCIVKK
jgi:hypothetical protein